MWLHQFDIISLSSMSGRNNMRNKYYRICFDMHAASVMLGFKLCNRSLGVHEIKRKSHAKRESDVAQSYTSSGPKTFFEHVSVLYSQSVLRNDVTLYALSTSSLRFVLSRVSLFLYNISFSLATGLRL